MLRTSMNLLSFLYWQSVAGEDEEDTEKAKERVEIRK